MSATIQVRAGQGAVERYQSLLREEWSRTTLEEVLALMRSLIVQGLKPDTYSWQSVLTHAPAKKSPKNLDSEILDRIRDWSTAFREPSIPNMPAEFTMNRSTQIAAQAEQTWTFLILQGMAKLEGDLGLLTDAQSLLYLCSTHFLLPQLKLRSHSAEHDCLVCAMYVHTLLVWRVLPSHMLNLQNVLMSYLGNTERQLELLDMSFHLTPPEDHSYLTRATAYWSELMNLCRYKEAWRFLWSLTRHAPDSCQEEIREMQLETISEAGDGSFLS